MAEKQKILIVDDDASISELISLYLEKEMFDTRCAADGEEALQLFPEYQPNLVVLDLMLPGIDGYEVCRRLRASSQVPVIMLSAKGETFDKVLGLELGADDYMVKPFESKELVARVKAVLRRYQQAQAQVNAAVDRDRKRDLVPAPTYGRLRNIQFVNVIGIEIIYFPACRVIGFFIRIHPREIAVGAVIIGFAAGTPAGIVQRRIHKTSVP